VRTLRPPAGSASQRGVEEPDHATLVLFGVRADARDATGVRRLPQLDGRTPGFREDGVGRRLLAFLPSDQQDPRRRDRIGLEAGGASSYP
jgi:hypothetical protein